MAYRPVLSTISVPKIAKAVDHFENWEKIRCRTYRGDISHLKVIFEARTQARTLLA